MVQREIVPKPAVLVVEADDLFRWSVARCLEGSYSVKCATSAAEALTELGASHFWALVVGCGLADSTCGELVRNARQVQRDLRVIVLAEYPGPLSDCDCHVEPCDCVVTKPTRLKHLKESIDSLLTRRT